MHVIVWTPAACLAILWLHPFCTTVACSRLYSQGIVHREAAFELAGTLQAIHGTDQSGYGRHLLNSGGSQTDQNTGRSYATPSSQLDQDVIFSYYGVFRQTFNHFANTNLSNYTLLPINGTCSSGAALPMPVTDCVANNRICCYNATRVQVRCRPYLDKKVYVGRPSLG